MPSIVLMFMSYFYFGKIKSGHSGRVGQNFLTTERSLSSCTLLKTVDDNDYDVEDNVEIATYSPHYA